MLHHGQGLSGFDHRDLIQESIPLEGDSSLESQRVSRVQREAGKRLHQWGSPRTSTPSIVDQALYSGNEDFHKRIRSVDGQATAHLPYIDVKKQE